MSQRGRVYQYYVEGECEKQLVEALKQMDLIRSGTVEVFNATARYLKQRKTILLKRNTIVVFAYDTDAGNPIILLLKVFGHLSLEIILSNLETDHLL